MAAAIHNTERADALLSTSRRRNPAACAAASGRFEQ